MNGVEETRALNSALEVIYFTDMAAVAGLTMTVCSLYACAGVVLTRR
jgi:hypothetical protein